MKVGETYLFHGHLHIIITDPEDDDVQAVAVVNFTGHEENKDQTCVVDIGGEDLVLLWAPAAAPATLPFSRLLSERS